MSQPRNSVSHSASINVLSLARYFEAVSSQMLRLSRLWAFDVQCLVLMTRASTPSPIGMQSFMWSSWSLTRSVYSCQKIIPPAVMMIVRSTNLAQDRAVAALFVMGGVICDWVGETVVTEG